MIMVRWPHNSQAKHGYPSQFETPSPLKMHCSIILLPGPKHSVHQNAPKIALLKIFRRPASTKTRAQHNPQSRHNQQWISGVRWKRVVLLSVARKPCGDWFGGFFQAAGARTSFTGRDKNRIWSTGIRLGCQHHGTMMSHQIKSWLMDDPWGRISSEGDINHCPMPFILPDLGITATCSN